MSFQHPPSILFEKTASEVARTLEIETDLAKVVLLAALKNVKTLDQKQKDYGPANLIKFGAFGVTVRLSDKIERIINLFKRRDLALSTLQTESIRAFNEPLADSFLDASNYSLIAYVMEAGLWPLPPQHVKPNRPTEDSP